MLGNFFVEGKKNLKNYQGEILFALQAAILPRNYQIDVDVHSLGYFAGTIIFFTLSKIEMQVI